MTCTQAVRGGEDSDSARSMQRARIAHEQKYDRAARALVTGASAGIGAALARELARPRREPDPDGAPDRPAQKRLRGNC